MRTEGSRTLAPSGDVVFPTQRLASSACELPPRLESVREARMFTRHTLQRWGLSELFDNVALVTSELVTNALRHGVGAEPGWPAASCPAAPPSVRLSLAHWTSRVVCSVRDPSDEGPMEKVPDFIAESGRGLHLVASCSDAWGWHPLAGTGKVVWALFPTPGNR
ncbi:ATP-binding protein [Streptomyces sp. SL13]|uniref:ATP-binding protein n=1 Tax=Streptantibioticus silvisoli TaxID=2705255 RepID=A0AA90HBT3_9ACTN|nr:ATP-binding protein [Streptantibioticus silvisoli]MDI5966089.1 ATP-binding protein [Streptantibioticus silvisoli]MDI5971947.1 ATP-binding protein [Streptantibioticus silvisoli]